MTRGAARTTAFAPGKDDFTSQAELEAFVAALQSAGLTQSWYYASSYDMRDKVVSMGGAVPDTGRNIAGLCHSVSFLIETRGVGIGRADLQLRGQSRAAPARRRCRRIRIPAAVPCAQGARHGDGRVSRRGGLTSRHTTT